MRLQKNPEGKAGKVWLTVEAVSTVKGDDVNGENLQSFGEISFGGPSVTPLVYCSSNSVVTVSYYVL
jgi:hypothetical protein